MLLRIYKAARYIQEGPSYYNSHTSNKEGLKKVLFRHSCFLPRESHCVVKFRSNYGDLDWDSTWKTLFSMPLDRKPIELCWNVAHGVLYTAHRLVSFGLNVPPDCFCGQSDETLENLFFLCALAQSGLDWIQSLFFLSSPLAPAITVRHVLFVFISDELLCVPRVFC